MDSLLYILVVWFVCSCCNVLQHDIQFLGHILTPNLNKLHLSRNKSVNKSVNAVFLNVVLDQQNSARKI